MAKEKLNNTKPAAKDTKVEQTDAKDSINISRMVQQQIDSARQKEIQRGRIKSEASILPVVTNNAKIIKWTKPLTVFIQRLFQ